jgi:hypothetical protein
VTKRRHFQHWEEKHGPVRPGYDIVKAASGYASLAATLSGFALAAVILLAQRNPRSCDVPGHLAAECAALPALRDGAAVAFTVALLSLVMAAFSFTAIHGEDFTARRTHNAGIWAGGALYGGLLAVLWGLNVTASIFLSKTTEAVMTASLVIVATIGLAFVIFSSFDAATRFDGDEPRFTISPVRYFANLGPPIGTVVVFAVVRAASGPMEPSSNQYVWRLVLLLVLSAAGTVGALVATSGPPDRRVPDIAVIAWACLCATVAGLLILAVPATYALN